MKIWGKAFQESKQAQRLEGNELEVFDKKRKVESIERSTRGRLGRA